VNPSSAQPRATASGSLSRTRSSEYEPPTSCTQAPSRRSIAGIAIIGEPPPGTRARRARTR
jgi:hypothetical protein